MTYATEFFAVQKALGVKVNGMSDSAFRQADEQNANRIQKVEKSGVIAFYVDGTCVVISVNGRNIENPPANIVAQFEAR